ncbi:MAG: class II aldolase/adducin family protein [bacterium]|nr:class II aldolase/adducin family protein [bacterium]
MTLMPPDAFLKMTYALGLPERDYIIIGEGNTSCRIDSDSFWIKASGQQMHNIAPEGFTAVQFAPILAMLDNPPQTLTEQNAIMKAAQLDSSARLPSVEVSFHAMLLAEGEPYGLRYVGHTHPTAINQILCGDMAETFARNRLFPDEVVLCGPESPLVPYVDPGLPLALAIREQWRAYIAQYGEPPKLLLLANHGLIALGTTPGEVLNVTAMAVKAARTFVGALSIGKPVFMSREDILHIYKRPDEIYRRAGFV